MGECDVERCWGSATAEEAAYHDARWCVPQHDDRELFAMLELEGMQAGLSWKTILLKERAIRAAFDGFDPAEVAAYDDVEIERVLAAPGVIRNRAKVRCAVSNAQAFLEVQREWGSFDAYIWHFTDGKVVDHRLEGMADMPACDEMSEIVSTDLKKRGFKFVGPVIVCSYLQGIGVYNDHLLSCPYRNHAE